jgi:hypothetical protein
MPGVFRARRRVNLQQPQVVSWLWFLAAYLLVVVAVMSLGGLFPEPTPHTFGWAD